MKQYTIPTSELVDLTTGDDYMLETSRIPIGGGGRFDTRQQEWWQNDWEDYDSSSDE